MTNVFVNPEYMNWLFLLITSEEDGRRNDDITYFLPLLFMAEVHCGQNHLPFGGWVIPTQA